MKAGIFILFLAAFLDLMQILVGLGISGVFAVLNFIPIIGQVASPIGIILGGVIDFCLSVSFGSVIAAALLYADLFYPQYLFSGWGLELLPGLDLLPGWTATVIFCLLRKKSEEGGVLAGAAGALVAAGSFTRGKAASGVLGSLQAARSVMPAVPRFEQQDSTQRETTRRRVDLTNPFDGVRIKPRRAASGTLQTANDNASPITNAA